jgi:hypothetical protein
MVIDLFDADSLAGEDLTEIDLLAIEANAAAAGDGDGLVMEGIFDLGETLVRAL